MTDASLSRATPRIPFFGPLAQAIARDTSTIFYLLVILLTLVVLAVKVWGLVALAMTALAMVPVMFVLLIAITQG